LSLTETQTSPDGRFDAIFAMHERMRGQWVAVPSIRARDSGTEILALGDDNLDGSVIWGAQSGHFVLALRRWPDPGRTLSVHVDVDGGTVRLGDGGDVHPLGETAALIAQHFAAETPLAVATQVSSGAEARVTGRKVAGWLGIALFVAAGLAALTGWLG
jgi:hypothetical protein